MDKRKGGRESQGVSKINGKRLRRGRDKTEKTPFTRLNVYI